MYENKRELVWLQNRVHGDKVSDWVSINTPLVEHTVVSVNPSVWWWELFLLAVYTLINTLVWLNAYRIDNLHNEEDDSNYFHE